MTRLASRRFSALRHGAYRRYWLGSFASVGATQLLALGQGWLVFELSGSPLMLGYLGAAIALPNIMMTLFGGLLADLVNKKHLLLLTSAVSCLLLLILTVLDATEQVTVWQVLIIAALFSLNSGVDWPARHAVFPALIQRSDMMSAVALNSVIWQSTRMVIPALGGLVIAFADTWIVFALCALGYLIMLLVIAGLPLPSGEPRVGQTSSPLLQLREGLEFTLTRRLFAMLILLNYGIMFFGSSYMQLLPIFADLLGRGESGYGLMLSVTGIGSVAGTWLVGYWQESRHLGRALLLSAVLSPLCLCGFALIIALNQSLPLAFPLALTASLITSVFASMFMIMSMTVLQLKVPDQLRGRVMGIHSITYSLMPLGGLLLGVVAAFSSAPSAVALSAACLLLLVLAIVITQPKLRQLDGRGRKEADG